MKTRIISGKMAFICTRVQMYMKHEYIDRCAVTALITDTLERMYICNMHCLIYHPNGCAYVTYIV
jgi:hypothetical protein